MNNIQDEILKLWNQNKSGMQIAVQLGVSRGVVMGHVHRMRQKGLIGYKENYSPKPPNKKPRLVSKDIKIVPAPEAREISKVFEFVEPKGPVTLMKLQGLSCRYIIGPTKGPDTLYCGKRKARGSYCEEHHQICFDQIRTKYSRNRA